MLSIEDVEKISREYRELAEHCDDRVLDIISFAEEADTLTFGEFTRRYERAIKQLEELV